MLGDTLTVEDRHREMVGVPDKEGVADCEAAVDTLDDLEVLLDWEGDGV